MNKIRELIIGGILRVLGIVILGASTGKSITMFGEEVIPYILGVIVSIVCLGIGCYLTRNE